MSQNRETLNRLLDENRIRIYAGELFETEPEPLPANLDFGKVEGMLLSLAVGDALGATTESQLPRRRSRVHGEIRDYIPNRYVDEPIGFPTDDTQLAFWTLEGMVEAGYFDPEATLKRFANRRIFGIGGTVSGALRNFHAGVPWWECGPESAGNGALMRIAPMVVPYLKRPSVDLWADTALSAMMTHNDFGSTSACLAFVKILWDLLGAEEVPDPKWWLESYVETARPLEGEARYTPRAEHLRDFEGPIWRFVEENLLKAHRAGMSSLDACNHWYSGAFLLETVPCVLYILMLHGHDPEEAIVRAVNDTRDNDTVAAIVGAAVGALHGKDAIPKRWLQDLSGRTTESDDGRVFELIERAREVFWDPERVRSQV